MTNLCAVLKTVDKRGVISHSAISVIHSAHTTSEVRATLQKKTYDESGAPNEYIVQNNLNKAFLNVF